MSLSVYVHIPYCIQRCRYCDFTTFEQHSIMPPERYTQLVLSEIRNRHMAIQDRHLRSVYFGGGTPSLIPAALIVSILRELTSVGFYLDESTEVTLEINPATVDEKNLHTYLAAGFNRFSVGAQTFSDRLLKLCGREHSADQTRQTLKILLDHKVNFSFDLLFALPGQSREDLRVDLEEVTSFQPHHLSAYCLTVPQGHPMSLGRPPEDEQVEMFDLIESHLEQNGLLKYEISNFSRPGFESRHNLAYWRNHTFWGLGLSAHSYFPDVGHGVRFWNPKVFDAYEKQVADPAETSAFDLLPADQVEKLQPHEALTDICHMHLRTRMGLPDATLDQLFESGHSQCAKERLERLAARDLVRRQGDGWSLTPQGELLSNLVFSELTFSSEELHCL